MKEASRYSQDSDTAVELLFETLERLHPDTELKRSIQQARDRNKAAKTPRKRLSRIARHRAA